MASEVKVTLQREGLLETGGPETPLLDLSDAAVKELIRSAKKRGYVTHDQISALLSSEEVKSEQIEDILAMFSEMGVNVVETEEAEPEDGGAREEPDDEEGSEGELVEVKPKLPAKTEPKEPSERTDDPVRMYMREMGTAELLSREGEIAIAKRIEAGREAMIAGLCESPLTFQAIIIWRDELNEGKVFLRDIIDLEATYAGPDAVKGMANPAMPGVPGAPGAVPAGAMGGPAVVAPPSAPPAATPFRPAPGGFKPPGAAAEGEEAAAPEGDDEDDMENSLSLAAIEAESVSYTHLRAHETRHDLVCRLL